jgi:hypothetical protein
MLNPNSKLRRLGRRPSASMVVACAALFLSLTGASYAAVTLSANSVKTVNIHGSAVTNPKIANNAVTYNKIKPSSVGAVRIVKAQVQARLQSTCAAGQAITAVDVNGKVTCGATGTADTNTAAATPVTVGTSATTITSLAMAGGPSYLVQANPYITVTPSTNASALDQHVVVTCTLASGSSTTAVATRSVSFDLPPVTPATGSPAPQVQTTSIPLTVAAPATTNATTSSVNCVSTVTATSGPGTGNAATNPATVTAQAPIYALQTASNTNPTTTTTTTTTPAA